MNYFNGRLDRIAGEERKGEQPMKATTIIQTLLLWLIAYSAVAWAWEGIETWLYGYTQPSAVDACIAVWVAAKITVWMLRERVE